MEFSFVACLSTGGSWKEENFFGILISSDKLPRDWGNYLGLEDLRREFVTALFESIRILN